MFLLISNDNRGVPAGMAGRRGQACACMLHSSVKSGDYGFRQRLLAVPKIHQPADSKKCCEEAAKRVCAIVEAVTVRALCNHPQHHRREQREKERSLEMRERHFWHYSFLPEAI